MNRLKSPTGRRAFGASPAAGAGALLCACGRARAQHAAAPEVPGGPPSTRSRALGAGAALLQAKAPLNAMDLYLNGFHFYADEAGRPVEAHHYCTHLTEEMHQCVIFDSNEEGARLIGIEYIVSERLFRELPEEEKPLWHSHHYETTSGQLAMPGVPEAVETVAMRQLSTTYGKTRTPAGGPWRRPAARHSAADDGLHRRRPARPGEARGAGREAGHRHGGEAPRPRRDPGAGGGPRRQCLGRRPDPAAPPRAGARAEALSLRPGRGSPSPSPAVATGRAVAAPGR
ncbi:DUF1264 domain-containing protein [Teichococcus aestuarii]